MASNVHGDGDMSSTNAYRDSTAVDYLDEVRKFQASAKAGKTANTGATPEYLLPTEDSGSVLDIVNVNDNRKSAEDTSNALDEFLNGEQPVLFRCGSGLPTLLIPISGPFKQASYVGRLSDGKQRMYCGYWEAG